VSEPTSILLLGGSGKETARLRRALSRHFLLVETAQDFDEARTLAKRCLFHILVLVDPDLPWARLRAACSECDDLPATTLLIVPHSRAESALAALRGGATDVLLRPFSTGELVASVKALGSSTAQPAEYPEDWTLEKVKNHHMARVLEASGGNKSAAARRLGVSRKTLERKLGTGKRNHRSHS
jgi:ActR/RegA family two-component response regulator